MSYEMTHGNRTLKINQISEKMIFLNFLKIAIV